MPNIVRMPAVRSKTGRCRVSIYNDISGGLFTKPVSIGVRAVGWPDYEVDAINAARIAGKSKDDIRALVARLHAKRSEALAIAEEAQ